MTLAQLCAMFENCLPQSEYRTKLEQLHAKMLSEMKEGIQMEKYLVWCPVLGSNADDSFAVMAQDPDDAALIWARREDSNSNYWIVGGQDADIIVRDMNGLESELTVCGESVPRYRVRKVGV